MLYTVVAIVLLGLVGAAAVVGFGLYNVSAAQGHLPGVSWLLHTTFRNSVKLRAPPSSAIPDLGAEGRVRLGAGHYDSACKMCHGAPGTARSATVRAINPVPPPIGEAVSGWEPAELFWIVRNGVKMSGMPAWPAEKREADVWSVVAFLLRVEEMDADAYRDLTARPPAGGDETLAYCAMCHGMDGRGHGNPQIPRLDILTPEYIALSLAAYRDERRYSGIMQHAASGLDNATVNRLAAHYGGQAETPDAPPDVADDPAARIVFGIGDNETASCAACHGPWDAPLAKEHPPLLGQRYKYLVEQMHLWRDGRRGGSERARLMHEVVPALEDEDISHIADFYARQPVGDRAKRE